MQENVYNAYSWVVELWVIFLFIYQHCPEKRFIIFQIEKYYIKTFNCLLLTILSHWYKFPWKCNLYWSEGIMWLARCFNKKGRLQSLFSGLFFQGFCPFSFLFLETWEWPPAQSNDLGFKCEMLAWSKCLKRGISSRTGGEVFLFSLLTYDATIRSLVRRDVASLRDPTVSSSYRKHFCSASPLLRVTAASGET